MRGKIVPLVKRLKDDAAKEVQNRLLAECRETMMRFESLKPFENKETFNAKVSKELRSYSPILSALITANITDTQKLFTFTAETILKEARQELPFWYKLPPFAWVLQLYVLICKKLGLPREEKKASVLLSVNKDSRIVGKDGRIDGKNRIKSRNTADSEWKEKLHGAIKRILGDLIPPGSTLQHELALYEQQWNPLLNIPMHTKLTEDVNASVRDNVQRSLKSIKMTDFTHVRLRKMADTLSSSPSLMKIENTEDLNMYIQLYILRILESV
jgi:hypothetical protein